MSKYSLKVNKKSVNTALIEIFCINCLRHCIFIMTICQFILLYIRSQDWSWIYWGRSYFDVTREYRMCTFTGNLESTQVFIGSRVEHPLNILSNIHTYMYVCLYKYMSFPRFTQTSFPPFYYSLSSILINEALLTDVILWYLNGFVYFETQEPSI